MSAVPYALLLLAGAACALLAVTYPMYDFDLWQHLAVGREIWRSHAVPATQVWSWPTYGQPEIAPSWLFRALLWPVWEAGGLNGVFAWRWVTTLSAFGLLLLAARRMGATGASAILALVWCALLYRQRSQARPETLVAILLAAQLAMLEARRGLSPEAGRSIARRALTWGLVPLACLWINVHISYYLFFVVGAGYLLDDLANRARRRAGHALALALALLAAAAACLVNPYGAKLLAQPFDFVLHLRHEEIFKLIGELGPIVWPDNLRNGLPALLLLIVAAGAMRWLRRGPDWAQLVVVGSAIAQAWNSTRFLGYMALLAAPFLARDLAALLRDTSWPAWIRPPGRRAGAVGLATILLTASEVARPGAQPGLGYHWEMLPVTACDWIEQQGVRGKAFNVFYHGGYLLWRFAPDSTRLPFMDVHQAGNPTLRYLYVYALQHPQAWRDLNRMYPVDWVVLPRDLPAKPNLLDFLDADSAWALVHLDDGGALYLRRDGPDSLLAARHGLRRLRAGPAGEDALVASARADSGIAREARAELERQIAASRWNARARALLSRLDAPTGP